MEHGELPICADHYLQKKAISTALDPLACTRNSQTKNSRIFIYELTIELTRHLQPTPREIFFLDYHYLCQAGYVLQYNSFCSRWPFFMSRLQSIYTLNRTTTHDISSLLSLFNASAINCLAAVCGSLNLFTKSTASRLFITFQIPSLARTTSSAV